MAGSDADSACVVRLSFRDLPYPDAERYDCISIPGSRLLSGASEAVLLVSFVNILGLQLSPQIDSGSCWAKK